MNPATPRSLSPLNGAIGKAQRSALMGHAPLVIWLTGLSGSGKSTLANALDVALHQSGHHAYLIDGDNLRQGLNKDLGFGDADRAENIRRVGEVCKLMVDAGLIVVAAFISPFRQDRDAVRGLLGQGAFVEVHVDASLAVCEARDPKGLYRRARRGEIPAFTGIDSPYEPPLQPELVLDTGKLDVPACLNLLQGELARHGIDLSRRSRGGAAQHALKGPW